MDRKLLHDKKGFPGALIVILVIFALAIMATAAVFIFDLDDAAKRYHEDNIAKLGLDKIFGKEKIFDQKAEEFALPIESSQECQGNYQDINTSIKKIEEFASTIGKDIPKFQLEEYYIQECGSLGLDFTESFASKHHIMKFSEPNETKEWFSQEKQKIQSTMNSTDNEAIKIIKASRKGQESFIYSSNNDYTIVFRYGNTLHKIMIEKEPTGIDGEESIMTEVLLSYADMVIEKMDKLYKKSKKD